MKKRETILSTLVQIFLTYNLIAQKLPTVQQNSLHAPNSIKIDGKATEWGNVFQAYNHATDLYYTLSNDDNNLYLIVRSADPEIIRRIFNGSIAFSVNKNQKKDDMGTISITYPIFEKNNRMSVNFKAKPEIIPGDEKSIMKADSFANVMNQRLENKSKTIGIKGINGLDTVISVYNEHNIKVAQLFDNKLNYTYELAVPLTTLGLSAASAKFFYHIMINEVIEHGVTITKDESGKLTGVLFKGGAQLGQPATDFWAEYTLAK